MLAACSNRLEDYATGSLNYTARTPYGWSKTFMTTWPHSQHLTSHELAIISHHYPDSYTYSFRQFRNEWYILLDTSHKHLRPCLYNFHLHLCLSVHPCITTLLLCIYIYTCIFVFIIMIFLFPDNTDDSHGHSLPAWATLANAALMLYWQHRPWGCSFVRRSYDTLTLTESQLCRPAPLAASTACHPGCVAVPLVIRCDKWVCSYVFFYCSHLLMTCVWSVESECWHTRHRTGHHLHICISQCVNICFYRHHT